MKSSSLFNCITFLALTSRPSSRIFFSDTLFSFCCHSTFTEQVQPNVKNDLVMFYYVCPNLDSLQWQLSIVDFLYVMAQGQYTYIKPERTFVQVWEFVLQAWVCKSACVATESFWKTVLGSMRSAWYLLLLSVLVVVNMGQVAPSSSPLQWHYEHCCLCYECDLIVFFFPLTP